MTKRVGEHLPDVHSGSRLVYHVWFSPRGRGFVLDGPVKDLVHELIDSIAQEKRIELFAHESHPDHVHVLLRVPAGTTRADAVKYLKGGSARAIFQRFPDLPLFTGYSNFWQRGYGHRWVPDSQIDTVRRYILAHRTEHNERATQPSTSVLGASPAWPEDKDTAHRSARPGGRNR